MILGKFLFAATALSVALPAGAAVTVIGSSSARMCYQSADNRGRADPVDLDDCDTALTTENLLPRDRVATFVNRGIIKHRLSRTAEAIADFDQALAAIA